MKRVIFVELKIEDNKDILNVFNQYNPDSSFVKPYICLVFPFKSCIEPNMIDYILEEVLENYGEISIKQSGISVSYEGKNFFKFLNVIDDHGLLNSIK